LIWYSLSAIVQALGQVTHREEKTVKLKRFIGPFRAFSFGIRMNGATGEFHAGYQPRVQALLLQISADAGNISPENIDNWVAANQDTWEVTPASREKMLDLCQYLVDTHLPREDDPWESVMEKFSQIISTLREEIGAES
jgi:hypothetical protein